MPAKKIGGAWSIAPVKKLLKTRKKPPKLATFRFHQLT
jgi:hypothetical protein